MNLLEIEFTPDEERELEQRCAEKAQNASGLLNFTPPISEPILSPFLVRGTIGMVHALPGVGKTWFAMQLAYSLATQTEFMTFGVPKEQLTVLYIDGECGRELIASRLRLMTAHKNVKMIRMKILCSDTYGGVMPLISEPGDQLEYEKELDGVDVVVIDNEYALSAERDNRDGETQKVKRIMSWYLKLKHRGKIIVHVHHSRKSLNDFGSAEQSGTGERTRPLDWSIALQKLPGLEDLGFKMSFDKSRHFIAPRPVFMSLNTDDDALNWAVKDVDEINLVRIKGAYRKLGNKWNEIASALKLPVQYIHELRLKYDIEGEAKTDSWVEEVRNTPIAESDYDDLF
jgi:hypothetical protein